MRLPVERTVITLLAALCGCGPSVQPGGGSGDGGSGGDPDASACGAACANACPGGAKTTLTGRVLAPNGTDPIPFAQVYVPRTIRPFPDTVSCELCSDTVGDALVSTETAVDGSFTLGPIPTTKDQAPGQDIQFVVQKGRFRKVSTVAITSPCDANTAPTAATTLPSKSAGMDSVPRIAVATGDYDEMECVLRDLGLDDGSFDLYNGITSLIGGTPGTKGDLDKLLKDGALMKQYDIIFLNCSGNEFEDQLGNSKVKGNIEDYVHSGGRLYVTDWSYDYIEQIPEFAPVIDFAPSMSGANPEPKNAAAIGPADITIDAQVQDDGLRAWLEAVQTITGDNVISAAGKVHIEHFLVDWVMQFAVKSDPTTKVWLTGNAGSGLTGDRPLTTTFDYQECGRVLYSSYHTNGRPEFSEIDAFPDYCSSGGLSPQERVLLYLILEVADCIGGVG